MRTHSQLRRSKGRTAHTAADSTKTAEIVLMMQHITAITVSACFYQRLRQRKVGTHIFTLSLLPVQLNQLLYRAGQLHSRVSRQNIGNSLRLTGNRFTVNSDITIIIRQLSTGKIEFAILLLQQRRTRSGRNLYRTGRRFSHRFGRYYNFILFLSYLDSTLLFVQQLLILFISDNGLLGGRRFISDLAHSCRTHAGIQRQAQQNTRKSNFFIFHSALLLYISRYQFYRT